MDKITHCFPSENDPLMGSCFPWIDIQVKEPKAEKNEVKETKAAKNEVKEAKVEKEVVPEKIVTS